MSLRIAATEKKKEGTMSYEEALRQIEEAEKRGKYHLRLINQGLTGLPPEIGRLVKLRSLVLRYNQLTELPPEIGRLKYLIMLDLSGNRLTELPPEIGRLTGLTKLYLWKNNLARLPMQIFQLHNLTSLDLRYNQLTELPSQIGQLPRLQHLELDNNPLISPPFEIINKGLDAVRKYLSSLKGASRVLSEVKIILVGADGAGKTSLSRCLMRDRFNPDEQTTHGIRLKNWRLDLPDRRIRCNLWDFGGQEIMHATHQFFLSRRSLYILVLDGREDERPEYWLRLIQTFGRNSSVLVVMNKYDSNPGFDLNRPELKRKFPCIRGFWRTSCATGLYVEDFKTSLIQELAKVPLIETRWANSWFAVKESLEMMTGPCISYRQFERICMKAGVSEKISQNVLAEFLADLGIMLYFKEFKPEDAHVFDPEWVTEAVYRIINDPLISERKGVLGRRDLREILRGGQGNRRVYERKDYIYLLGLMKRFELCCELDDEQILLPQLLGVPEPEFTFDEDNAVFFFLSYKDILPPAVMPRFIVRQQREIKDDLRWRTGVVLKHPLLDASAVVRADNEIRRIHIMVSGRERKVYLALLWLSLREINSSFAGLRVSERVSVPHDPSVTVDYETLLNKRQQKVERFVPEGAKRAYSVQELLDAVHPDDPSEGKKIITALRPDEREGGMQRLAKVMNTYFQVEPKLFSRHFNYTTLFEDLLKKG